MKLNVIIPTFNRAPLLRRTLESLRVARPAGGLEVLVTVVDNNSTDGTKETVAELQPGFPVPLEYLFEPRQGKSQALNTAIARADADLIAVLDDDEEVAPDWFVELERVFAERWDELDFVGGKVSPRWESEPPAWVTPRVPGVIGWRDFGDEEWAYTAEGDILSGGHSIIKLSVLREIGLYNEDLGPAGKNLLGCEDEELFHRLMKAGKRGIYYPRLVIYHFVPEYRLTKKYFRGWCYGAGMSQFKFEESHEPFQGPRVLGVPRYMYGDAVRGVMRWARALFKGEFETAFVQKRPVWILLGFFSARNLKSGQLEKPVSAIINRGAKPVTR
jgi:glucosyl-dolichyl phosphate glucuronosyltransferase